MSMLDIGDLDHPHPGCRTSTSEISTIHIPDVVGLGEQDSPLLPSGWGSGRSGRAPPESPARPSVAGTEPAQRAE